MTTKANEVARKLVENRDFARRLYGAEWPAKAAPYRELLEGAMREIGKDAIAAALPMALELEKQGKSPMMLLAVAADMASERPAR